MLAENDAALEPDSSGTLAVNALSPKEQLVLEIARMIREDFLFQNAYDAADAYTSLKKQYRILRAIFRFMDSAEPVIAQEDFDFQKLRSLPIKEEIAKSHLYPETEIGKFDDLEAAITKSVSSLLIPA
jgi:V/A-type H+-transporting ATPase subunit A